MRVALVHPYPWPEVRRGAERYLDDLAWYLAGRGHQVTVVTGTHERPCVQTRSEGLSVHYRSHVRFRGAERLRLTEVETFGLAALPVLLRRRADVVHAFTPSGALAGRGAGRPTVYTVLGHPEAGQLPADPLPRRLFLRAVRAATVTACLSRASAAALADATGQPSVVLPPGVRTAAFAPELEARRGAARLLFAASLADPRKRVDIALDALDAVLDREPSSVLVLSGAGEPGPALAAAAARGDRVRRAVEVAGPGRPADVPGRYRSSTVTLLPAEHEAFGLALVESLACGTPVVCTPSGGMPEIVGGHPVGRVAGACEGRAVAEAVRAALSLARRPGTPARCVDRARRWDWESEVGPAHEQLYRAVADGGRRRWSEEATRGWTGWNR